MNQEPVAIWPIVGVLVGAILTQFLPTLGTELIDAIVQFVVLVLPVALAAWYARSKVTPTSNPKDAQGRKLVPESAGAGDE